MPLLNRGLFIVSAKRTPFGSFGGLLQSKTCTDLAEIASKSCISAANLDSKLIETVVFGNVVQSNRDTASLARHAGIRAGVPIASPALTVNRMCGSGFQAVISAAHDMLIDGNPIALAGGSENMSEIPFVARNIRFGTRFGSQYKLEDVLWDNLVDHQFNVPMGITAENLAEKHNISREECDQMALRSQTRWQEAHKAGVFAPELCPVSLVDKRKKPMEMGHDEHPRETTMEQLAKLKPAFKSDGVTTAGNASGISDGAAALLLATEEAVTQHGLKPLARLTAYSVVGCEPTLMGIGPAVAINRLMPIMKPGSTGQDASDYFDLIEVNEAFSAQYLAVERELKLNPDITNRHGGAIAIGHPIGASGARILAHLAHQLSVNGGRIKRAVGSACIGGGQGIAVALEAV